MDLQVGVKVLLKNKKGKYLLVKRSPEKYPDVGKAIWDIPGGRIHPGSALLENLKREVQEEVDLTIETSPRLVGAQDILRGNDKHVVRLTYVGEIDGTPRLSSDENIDFEWFTPEQLKGLEDIDRYLKELIDTEAFPLI